MSHLDDLVSAWLDGELVGTERDDADRHLAGCDRCRDELAAIAAARRRVRGLPSLALPPGMIPVPAPRRRSAPAWAVAVALAVLAVGLAVGPGEPGTAFRIEQLSEQHTARVVGDPGVATFRGDAP